MSHIEKPEGQVEYYREKISEANEKADKAKEREKAAKLQIKSAWEEEMEAREHAKRDWERYQIRSKA